MITHIKPPNHDPIPRRPTSASQNVKPSHTTEAKEKKGEKLPETLEKSGDSIIPRSDQILKAQKCVMLKNNLGGTFGSPFNLEKNVNNPPWSHQLQSSGAMGSPQQTCWTDGPFCPCLFLQFNMKSMNRLQVGRATTTSKKPSDYPP